MHNPSFSQRAAQLAHFYAVGKLAWHFSAIIGLFTLLIAAIWLACQVAYILIGGSIELLSALGAAFQSADPAVKLVLLMAGALVVWLCIRRATR